MAADPRIALAGQPPNFFGPAQVAEYQNMLNRNRLQQMELEQAQQQAQGSNALRSLYASPQNFAPGPQGQPGQPTPNALQQFASSGGDVATLQNKLLAQRDQEARIAREVAQTRKAEEEAQRSQVESYAKAVLPIGRSTLAKYNELRKKGVSVDEASRQSQELYGEQISELERSGLVPKSMLEKAKAARFNPFVFQARISQLSAMIGEKSESSIGKLDDDLRAGRITQSEHDAAVAKATGGAGGSTGGGLPKGVKEFILPTTGKHYGSGNGMAFELAEDGTWKKISPAELPQKMVKVGSLGVGQGAREAVFTQRKIGSANQAAADLANIIALPITADRGAFGGFGTVTAPSFLDAGKVVLGNKMTPESAQVYNRMATGFQRSLATIEAQGLMPSGSLTHQMDAVMWKPGDTALSKMHALAQIRQIIESQMDVELHNPRISDDEKELVKNIQGSVRRSVPFTHMDLINLDDAQRKNPKVTMREVLAKMKKAAGQAEGGSQGAPKRFSKFWAAPKPAKRGSSSPAQALSAQGEDPDDDADDDKE